MKLILFSAPIVEPVSLTELKAHLRLDSLTFAESLGSTQSIAPGLQAVNELYALEGTGVNVFGYPAIVYFQAGTCGANGTVDVKIQESDDNSTYTDWMGGAFEQVTTETDNATYEKEYTGNKSYIRTVASVKTASCSFGTSIVTKAAVTDAILRDLSINPWQLFAPDPRRIYFGASGGGANIFESTFADSWSLSDTYSASATLVSTYADSPTVTDSSSSSAVFASAFDETIPVSDGPSADMGGVANRTQEESFTITDAYSASMVANATISETLSAEASASAAAIFNATFAETLPIVDGEEADAGKNPPKADATLVGGITKTSLAPPASTTPAQRNRIPASLCSSS